MTITLPPLRERTDDIPTLAEHFLAKFNKQNNRKLSQVGSRIDGTAEALWSGPATSANWKTLWSGRSFLADREAGVLTPDLLPHTLHLYMEGDSDSTP